MKFDKIWPGFMSVKHQRMYDVTGCVDECQKKQTVNILLRHLKICHERQDLLGLGKIYQVSFHWVST